MKLNHMDITVQKYTFEKIENDIILYHEERKTVLIVNNTAITILNAITTAVKKKRISQRKKFRICSANNIL